MSNGFNQTLVTPDVASDGDLWVAQGILPNDFTVDTESTGTDLGNIELGLRGHIKGGQPFASQVDSAGIAHYYMADGEPASFIYSVDETKGPLTDQGYTFKMIVDTDPSVSFNPNSSTNAYMSLVDGDRGLTDAVNSTRPYSDYKWDITDSTGTSHGAITDDQGDTVLGGVTQNSEPLSLFTGSTGSAGNVKPGAYDIVLQAFQGNTLVASTHIQDDVGLITATNAETIGTLASSTNGQLYQGSGNPIANFAIVDTSSPTVTETGSQFELGIGVQYTSIPAGSLLADGPITTSTDSNGTVHYAVTQNSSTPGIRFAYSVANTQGDSLSDYFGLYNFELSIDVDPSAGTAGLLTYFLEPQGATYGDNTAADQTKNSGYVWVLDKNGNGKIDPGDTQTPDGTTYYTIPDDEGNSSVTQNIETPAFFDPTQALSKTDLATGSYNVSLTIADKTGAVQAQDNVVIDVNGGAPVTQNGGGGGGGGAPPVTTPSGTPPSTTPVVTGTGTNSVTGTALPAPTISIDPTISVDGKTVTITADVASAAGVQSVELYEGTTPVAPGTLNADGTYSFAFDNTKGFHTGLSAVVTDVQGLSGAAVTNFDLTGVTGQPYNTVQDNYDPTTSAYLGSNFVRASGVAYFESTNTTFSNGDFTYSYANGSYFDNKIFSSFVDKYDANGDLLTHVENNNDGSHAQEIDANGQTVKALGTDTFADYANKTSFVFSPGFGQEAIYGFQATGAAHDTLHISSSAGTLAQVLSKATSDGQGGTTLNLGANDTIDLVNITKAELKANKHDFSFSASA